MDEETKFTHFVKLEKWQPPRLPGDDVIEELGRVAKEELARARAEDPAFDKRMTARERAESADRVEAVLNALPWAVFPDGSTGHELDVKVVTPLKTVEMTAADLRILIAAARS